MNRITGHPFVVLGVIAFFAVTALVVFRLNTGAKPDPQKTRLITVGTVSPLKEDLDIRLSYTADISPNQVVNLFSRVDGYVAKLHVDKGDFVKAGQLLMEIDHTDYLHAVNQAKANLAAGAAKVAQQKAALRNARLTLDRMQALIKDQFVSQQDLDNAQVNFDAAVAALESLEAQVKQMEVALAQADTNLAYSYIRAPFAGYIAERNLDTGAYVTGAASSTSTMSRSMLSLHDIDRVR
ncbi:MAG: efflux RND transporter periplasmic adaptor subunit, partial [Nitrospira sp.]|nr:efflux RND transporter periplasmic adaptor subunit [Nitrospira sp.]